MLCIFIDGTNLSMSGSILIEYISGLVPLQIYLFCYFSNLINLKGIFHIDMCLLKVKYI